MKFMILIALLFSLESFASKITLATTCYTIKDSVDRDYCHKKRMQLIKKEMSKDKTSWRKKLTSKTKKLKQAKLKTKLTEQQAQLNMLTEELEIYKAHQLALNKAKPVKRKKKKKKDSRSDIEKALNIKL